jgi:hypothetical protein
MTIEPLLSVFHRILDLKTGWISIRAFFFAHVESQASNTIQRAIKGSRLTGQDLHQYGELKCEDKKILIYLAN